MCVPLRPRPNGMQPLIWHHAAAHAPALDCRYALHTLRLTAGPCGCGAGAYRGSMSALDTVKDAVPARACPMLRAAAAGRGGRSWCRPRRPGALGKCPDCDGPGLVPARQSGWLGWPFGAVWWMLLRLREGSLRCAAQEWPLSTRCRSAGRGGSWWASSRASLAGRPRNHAQGTMW